MAFLFPKAIYEMDEEYLNETLRQSQYRESQHIEYKLKLGELSKRDIKKEFIKDVTSMANSFGGFLIIGVQEENGSPATIIGFDTSSIGINHNNEDDLKNSLQNIILDNTEPRLAGVRIQTILLTNGKHVILFEIPQSPLLPHRNTLDNKFYYRYDTKNEAMSVNEIRALMVPSESFHEKLEGIRKEQIAKVLNGKDQELYYPPKTILHIIPARAIASRNEIDLSQMDTQEAYELNLSRNLPPNEGEIVGEKTPQWSDEGLIVANGTFGYVKIYFSGMIEIVDSALVEHKTSNANKDYYLNHFVVIVNTIRKVCKFYQNLNNSNISLPFGVSIFLKGIKGFNLPISRFYRRTPSFLHPFEKDELMAPPCIIESYNDISIWKSIKPAFDKIWQAAGCPNASLDENGNIISPNWSLY